MGKLQAALPDEVPILSLPDTGCTPADVLLRMREREKKNLQVSQDCSTVSGAVYMQGHLESLSDHE